MNLLGEAVKHKRFGKGVITGLSDNKITICFAKSQKLFLFPDAFTQHLTLKNNSIQKKVEKLNDERLSVIKAKKQKFEKEKEYKMLNVKLFDGSFLTLFNAKDASSHHNI